MIIKLGDTITDERGRTGVINQIANLGLQADKTDVAGELGLKAKEYDTDLNYTGSVCFDDNWCYF